MTSDNILKAVDTISINAQDSKMRIEQAKELLKKLEAPEDNPFPTDAFPRGSRYIIETYADHDKLPVEWYGLSLIMCAATLIGNRYRLELSSREFYPAIFYACIVGAPSSGKTPVMAKMLKPIERKERLFQNEYNQEKTLVEAHNNLVKSNQTNEPTLPQPIREDLLVNDVNLEGLNKVMQNNPRGILGFNDELRAWIGSMNQYRQGSDLEHYLAIWNNATVKVNRSSKETIFIERYCANIYGGIQPGVLKSIVNGNNRDNGLVARMLFAFPNNFKKPYRNLNGLPEPFYSYYDRIMDKLDQLPDRMMEGEYGEAVSYDFKMTDNARQLFRTWCQKNVDEQNKSTNETIVGILGKMEAYCLRFALVLHVLELAESLIQYDYKKHIFKPTDNHDLNLSIEALAQNPVTSDTVQRAIKLVYYFTNTSVKVLSRVDNRLQALHPTYQAWYESLPDEVTTKQAVEIADAMGIGERTVKRYLKEKDYFKKVARGVYEKLIF